MFKIKMKIFNDILFDSRHVIRLGTVGHALLCVTGHNYQLFAVGRRCRWGINLSQSRLLCVAL